VCAVAVHPSGKLALSVGTSERNLKTWNLIKGRTGFVTNLHGSIGEAVAWSPEGNFYAVGLSSRVDVYAVETAKVVYSAQFGKRISRIIFINVSPELLRSIISLCSECSRIILILYFYNVKYYFSGRYGNCCRRQT